MKLSALALVLAGLSHQSYEVREITVVDSNSEDGTPAWWPQKDPRFRIMTDDPYQLAGWGRWALHNGFCIGGASEWILGVDADTQPSPGLVASLVKTAQAGDMIWCRCRPNLSSSIQESVGYNRR